ESIRLLTGAISCLLFTNSCNKSEPFLTIDHQNRNIDYIFLNAMKVAGCQKIIYLINEIKTNQYNTNSFLRDRFTSERCDEIHAFGRIRRISNQMSDRRSKSKSSTIFCV